MGIFEVVARKTRSLGFKMSKQHATHEELDERIRKTRSVKKVSFAFQTLVTMRSSLSLQGKKLLTMFFIISLLIFTCE